MSFRRKRALIVAGGVATMFAAGGFLSPGQAEACPFSICVDVAGTAEDLGIIPDPSRQIFKDVLSQDIYPAELQPLVGVVDGAYAPAQTQVRSLTTTGVDVVNETTAPVTEELRGESVGGVELYECEAKHDHKVHKNHQHCEG